MLELGNMIFQSKKDLSHGFIHGKLEYMIGFKNNVNGAKPFT